MERRGGESRKGLPTREKSKKVPPLDEINSEDGEEGTVVSDGDGGEEEKKTSLCSSTGTNSLCSPPPTPALPSSSSSSTGIFKKGAGVGLSSTWQLTCQAEKCTQDLTDARRYYRRHKVCEVHSKAPVVIVAGLRQRFCQQCSRFHDLTEFDDTKRSCRKRLAGHNERRRKISSETQERVEPMQAG